MLIVDMFSEMDEEAFKTGNASPVFFGSALNNFGLDVFLNYFRTLAPPPQPYEDADGQIRDLDKGFSGFVFKLQANMNPDHRDCAAFVRVTSGKFERGLEVTHQETGRKVRMSTPHTLMGDERNILEEAWPGDIVSLLDTDFFRIVSYLYASAEYHIKEIPHIIP